MIVGIGEAAAGARLAVVEGQTANALRRSRNQHRPERAVEESADGLAAPAVAPGRWRHAEPLLGIAIETARARIAGVVDRVGHSSVLFERRFGALGPNPRAYSAGETPRSRVKIRWK